MAGHSKWANIQHRKRGQDAKRGKLFTKLIREITIAARLGGGDANANPRLRAVIDKSLIANMTKDTIERAVKRGAGGLEGMNVEEVRYEGYGPHGVAIMVDCMTDNRNRTVAEVRHAFSRGGGNLGTDGSVAYLFSKRGEICFAPGVDEDRVMELALELGADDVLSSTDGSLEVVTSSDTYLAIKDGLIAAGLQPNYADCTMLASLQVAINDKEVAESLLGLIDRLEDLDDVQEVYSNADIASDVLEQLS